MSSTFPGASYDAWKTRSPDDERFCDDRSEEEEYLEEVWFWDLNRGYEIFQLEEMAAAQPEIQS